MWSDAVLENWRLRQRVELSTARPMPSDDAVAAPSNPSPYERVETAGGIVRFRRKPAPVVPLPDDSVADLWRDGEDGRD